jgi:hypothetical protein
VSAHSASHRGGWLSALVAQVSDYVFEEIEETVEQPQELVAHPVVAVVAAAPRSGTTTLARLLAAELASRRGRSAPSRSDGSAVVLGSAKPRRAAPPARAAARLATALGGAVDAQPLGRICVAPSADRASDVNAARYLAPVVLDVAADGSAAGIADVADRIVVVTAASGEPALLDAVATVVGGNALKVANRVTEPALWEARADVRLPESRMAARAATMGTRALGPLGSAIAALADALEVAR